MLNLVIHTPQKLKHNLKVTKVSNVELHLAQLVWKKSEKCVCEIQYPILANSNEGHDHNNKKFNTSRKILSQKLPCTIWML